MATNSARRPAAREANTTERARRFTDVDGVARYVDVSVHFVRRLVLERRIPHYKVGGLLRFDLEEVDAWMATLQREARVEPRRT